MNWIGAEFDPMPQIIVALVALGMGLSFVVADRHSRTSRTLAMAMASVGISIALATVSITFLPPDVVARYCGVFAIPDVLAFLFGYEWILRVRRTIPARNLNTSGADRLLRNAQVLVLIYGALSLAFPQARWEYFLGGLGKGLQPQNLGFYLFSVPLELSMLLAAVAVLITLRRRPDRAERIRLLLFICGAPLMASGLVLPSSIAPVTTVVGLLIFLVGAVQYHVIQGQRAQFLSRFLAPQVAELVREQGLSSATDERSLEVSVLCCDLRGFTAHVETTSATHVIGILREYYNAVGEATAEVGGTIKDQAGDGVLILLGAPISFADHAERAIQLAQSIIQRCSVITRQHSGAGLSLGIGVGVATGMVTVGVIGAASRLEYTAVGGAVNLAARLCAEAADGQVRIAERTIAAIAPAQQPAGLEVADALQLKGFKEAVANFQLQPLAHVV